jgi:hypothetical protein
LEVPIFIVVGGQAALHVDILEKRRGSNELFLGKKRNHFVAPISIVLVGIYIN